MTKRIAESPAPRAATGSSAGAAAGAHRGDGNGAAASRPAFDARKIREDFPILRTTAHGKPLIYLDNAATTQKPQPVLDALSRYYRTQNANIHRGVYALSQEATGAYESAREKVRRFINAPHSRQIIFTRGTTESINLIASSFGRQFVKAGDEIVISAMEHHSNIVPWQMLCEQTGARLRVIPMNDAGELLLDEYEKLLSDRTRLVAVNHVSNSLGTVNPIQRIIELAHARGAKVLIDGAQWVAHGRTDVQAYDCDFYAFSGHKMFGPTGVGVLYGKLELLEAMPPYQGGGDMIASVTFEKTTYAELPNKFEAGTPNIAGVVGLGAAVDYLRAIDVDAAAAYEQDLLRYATAELTKIPGVRPVGAARHKASVLSFVLTDPPVSSLDVGTKLDHQGVAVRTGHHCCQPVMDRFQIPSTARMSLAMYNTREDVDAFIGALRRVRDDAAARLAKEPATTESVSPSTALRFPEPAADSPQAAADELAETFDFLGEWDQRYGFVIELGEKLPPMPAVLKIEANRVRGCQSTVHLWSRLRPGTADGLDFLADSDADIVRGLIAILQKIFAGQSAREVLAFDVDSFFRRLGLDEHLSMGRRNGLAGMVQRIKTQAAELATAAAGN